MKTYRPDIDGLRAMAVIAVLAYHAFPTLLTGGFYGVDVFFVISGYLITQLILRELEGGSFSLLAFYERRIRRIVPALAVVLIATGAFGWYVLTPSEMAWFGKSLGWSAVFLGNGFLATSGGYFDDSAFLNPLEHLWSLGVEEQFYLVRPILLLASWKRGVTAYALLAVALTSFVISLWGSARSPEAHFYFLSCRAWELALGGLLAAWHESPRSELQRGESPRRALLRTESPGGVSPGRESPRRVLLWSESPRGVILWSESSRGVMPERESPRRVLSWRGSPAGGSMRSAGEPGTAVVSNLMATVGLVALLCSVGLLDDLRAFPRWWSVVPTAATALLVCAGPSAWINRCVLSVPALTFIGRLSYSLYLWHWPLLAFCRIISGRPLSAAVSAEALGFSFALAVATYHFVESPIRFGPAGTRAVPGLVAALGVCALFGAALYSSWIPARLGGSAAVTAFDRARTDWSFAASTFRLESQLRPARTAVFIGDSHMQQYWSRVSDVVRANPESARSAEFATYIGCPPLPGITTPSGESCDLKFSRGIDRAFEDDVDTVVFAAFWEDYLQGEFATGRRPQRIYSVGDARRVPLDINSGGTQKAFAGFREVVARLVASGRRVFIVLSNPTSPLLNPASMLPGYARLALRPPAQITVDSSHQAVDAAAFAAFVAPTTRKLREVAEASGATVLDPRPYLCNPSNCPALGGDGIPLYEDSNHLRSSYARVRAVFLDQAILGISQPGRSVAR